MAEQVFSLEAEQALIGGLLVSPVAFSDVAEIVSADNFHDVRHRLAFGAMAKMAASQRPIDLFTVAEQLESSGDLGDDGLSYLGALARDTPSAANVLAYAELVRSKSTQRALMTLGLALQEKAFREPPETVLTWLSTAIQGFDVGKSQSIQKISAFVQPLIDRIDADFQGIPTANPAIPTGLEDLDALLNGGVRAGQLVVIAGRPAMGKSVLGMQIASRIARSENTNALVFSLEMTGEELAERELAARGDIPLQLLKSGQLDDDGWTRLTSATIALSDAKIWIDDTPGLSLQAIQSRARRMQRKQKVGLVVVDHIGLVGADGRNENRQQEVSKIARELKNLSKELKCPVIALGQLNRELERRQNKRPMMSDLRESGEIEQSADIICFIYRDEIYDTESPDKGCAELIIGKQRGGKTGMIPTAFLGETATFADLLGGLPSSRLAPKQYSRGLEL